jgi:hypothetical protein
MLTDPFTFVDDDCAVLAGADGWAGCCAVVFEAPPAGACCAWPVAEADGWADCEAVVFAVPLAGACCAWPVAEAGLFCAWAGWDVPL